MNSLEKDMNKPTPKTKTAYSYTECRDYLQEKYGYKERDYAGKFKHRDMDDIPYQDFWHWVVGNYQIHNGCYVTFTKEVLDEIQEDWVKTIYSYYLHEFALDKNEVTFYVEW
jgi:hypothetical protein